MNERDRAEEKSHVATNTRWLRDRVRLLASVCFGGVHNWHRKNGSRLKIEIRNGLMAVLEKLLNGFLLGAGIGLAFIAFHALHIFPAICS